MNDFKFAFRQLLKNPGFTAVAVLTLALGIGLNTAMFSFINALLLRPLPFPESERLVRLQRVTLQSPYGAFSPADFLELKREQAGFGRFAGYHQSSLTLADSGRSTEWLRVSTELFDVLGLRPVLGRSFRPEDAIPGNDRVAMLSYRMWQDRFGGASDVVGQTLRGDDQTFAIIGVLPPSATDRRLFGQAGLFSPLSLAGDTGVDRSSRWINVLGRRDSSVSVAQGNAFIESLGARLAADFPAENAGSSWRSEALPESTMSPTGKGMLAMLLGLSGLVLLIACSNLANLLLARVVAGTREYAVRAALGASRLRLIRPLACESLLLAIAGGAGALLVAGWTNEWLRSVIATGGGPAFEFPMDWRVLGFAMGVSVLTLGFFGVAPALFTTRINANDTLKSGSRGATAGRGQHRFRQFLVAGQFSLALVLLAGAGFFVRGSVNLLQQDFGWNADNVLQARIELPAESYPGAGEISALHRQLVERLEQAPGVGSASISYGLPYLGLRGQNQFVVEGGGLADGRSGLLAKINGVTPSYFEVTGTRLIAGRHFDHRDHANAPKVAILNQTMARTLFPDRSPLGGRISSTAEKNPEQFEIVGIVEDVRSIDVAQAAAPFQFYQPAAQDPRDRFMVAVRTAGMSTGVAQQLIRSVVNTLDPELVVRDLQTASEAMQINVLSQMRLCQQLLLAFAVLGLLLATLGIYGTIARLVVQRTGEIGIRMALGAQVQDVIKLVLGSGMRIALVGSALGLLGAVGFARLLAALLPMMDTNGAWVLVGTIVVLIMVTLLACWLPARRAARVDPMVALRQE